jgi:RNA polymerase sigma-70 factor (ECF subfamily)
MPKSKNPFAHKSVISIESSNVDLSDPEIPEPQIVEMAIKGSMDAFSVLYQRNINKIFSYIFYRTGNTHDAEDLTARVFHRAMMHIRSYVNTGVPFSAWLYRIAHNLVANWHRDNERKREVPLEDNDFKIPGTKFPESTVVDDQDVEFLLKSIRKLSGERQTLIILKYVEDFSNSEIAQIMGRSEGAIKSLYHRTLLALRYELEKNEKDFSEKK